MRESPLRYEKVSSLVLKYAIPSIISGLVGALYNIVDQIFISRGVGIVGNAATNVSMPLVTMGLAVSLMMGAGAAAAYNQKLGAREVDKAKKIMGTTISLNLIFAVIMMIAIIPNLRYLLYRFGSNDEVMPYALSYSKIIMYGYVFFMMQQLLPMLIRADGSPKVAMITAMSGAIINTILDPIFIFVLNMGIEGAAWATIIAQLIATIIGFVYIFKHIKYVELEKKDFMPDRQAGIFTMKLGLAPFSNQMAMLIMQIFLNAALNTYGGQSEYGQTIPLAVVGVVTKVTIIYLALVIGISQGTQPIEAFNYGAKSCDRAIEAAKLNIRGNLIVSFACFILIQLFPEQIISIFGKGSEKYVEFAVKYMRIYMLMITFNGMQPASSFLFTAIGKPLKGILISLTRHIIFFIPTILIMSSIFGLHGVLYTGPIADGAAAIVSFLLLNIELKKLKSLNKEQVIA